MSRDHHGRIRNQEVAGSIPAAGSAEDPVHAIAAAIEVVRTGRAAQSPSIGSFHGSTGVQTSQFERIPAQQSAMSIDADLVRPISQFGCVRGVMVVVQPDSQERS